MARHLHDTLPFLLNRISARLSEAVNDEFQPLGLNIFAARVLILLHLEGPATVGQLAERASLEQSTLSHIVRRLVAQGLLHKERQTHDNRSVVVELTGTGLEKARICWDAARRHDALLRKDVDAESLEALKSILLELYRNVPAFQKRSQKSS